MRPHQYLTIIGLLAIIAGNVCPVPIMRECLWVGGLCYSVAGLMRLVLEKDP